jgi:hypothetical protein
MSYEDPARPQVGDEGTIVTAHGHKLVGRIQRLLPEGIVTLERKTIRHAAECPCRLQNAAIA